MARIDPLGLQDAHCITMPVSIFTGSEKIEVSYLNVVGCVATLQPLTSLTDHSAATHPHSSQLLLANEHIILSCMSTYVSAFDKLLLLNCHTLCTQRYIHFSGYCKMEKILVINYSTLTHMHTCLHARTHLHTVLTFNSRTKYPN